LLGVPIAIVMTPLAWVFLTRIAFRVPATSRGSDETVLRRTLAELGPMSIPERRVLLVFVATALLWVFRADLDVGIATIPGWTSLLPNPRAVDDTVIAVAMATLLFLLPSGDGVSRLLGDDWTKRVPWGVLVLLGSGFTLAAAVESSGLAAWLAARLGQLGAMPPLLLVLLITTLLVLLTEFTVNSAITALMMPVLAATAVGLRVDPRLLMIPATLGASFGFMMPGGTAPNAMVFASGRITVPQMVRAGIGIDIVGIIVITAVFWMIGLPVFGIATEGAPPWVH
ncbi:MAG: SLC13 family permease, partial [Candidatus Binatia bacterium]